MSGHVWGEIFTEDQRIAIEGSSHHESRESFVCIVTASNYNEEKLTDPESPTDQQSPTFVAPGTGALVRI